MNAYRFISVIGFISLAAGVASMLSSAPADVAYWTGMAVALAGFLTIVVTGPLWQAEKHTARFHRDEHGQEQD